MGVTFIFSLNQKVVIEDTGIEGKVSGLMVDRDSVQWADVRYLNTHKEFKSNWFREADLAALGTEAA